MSHSVQMPALGESVTEGTVTRWLKAVGEEVAVDEPLLEVSTDKVDTEIPSPYAGVLEKIIVGEDETAEVGAELGVIGDGSGASGDGARQRRWRPAADAGGARSRTRTGGGARRAVLGPAEAPSTDTDAPAEKPTAGTGGVHRIRDLGDAAGDGRVGHRGHRHPLAQGRR